MGIHHTDEEVRGSATPLTLKADVCIVGTGPGGAATGYELAKAGVKVVFLEAGYSWQPEQFIPKPSIAYRNLYQEQNARIMEGNAFIPLPGGRGVGGTSLVNSAICLRAPERTRRRWAGYGIPWMAPDTELDGIYDEVSKIIQVTKMSPEQVRGNSMIFKKGVDALGLTGDFVSRNAPGCVGCGVCQLGCPSAGKASVDRNFITDAMALGAEVYTGVRVDKVRVEQGRCRGVDGSVFSQGGSAPVGAVRVEAGRTVISGSAVGTPMLLQRSNVANRSGQVGRNLHVHICTGTVALFDEEIRAWSGAAQGYYVDVPEEELILETATATPELFFMFCKRLMKGDLQKMNRMALCGVVVRDESAGTVENGPNGTAKIKYSVNDVDRRHLIEGLRRVCKIYAAAGAVEVRSGISNLPETKTLDQALAQLTDDIEPTDLMLYATHPQGTCRMGADPDTSVVRPDGRTHDVESLYIADGSLFPDALGVNPQLTIMAVATHIARQMVRDGVAKG